MDAMHHIVEQMDWRPDLPVEERLEFALMDWATTNELPFFDDKYGFFAAVAQAIHKYLPEFTTAHRTQRASDVYKVASVFKLGQRMGYEMSLPEQLDDALDELAAQCNVDGVQKAGIQELSALAQYTFLDESVQSSGLRAHPAIDERSALEILLKNPSESLRLHSYVNPQPYMRPQDMRQVMSVLQYIDTTNGFYEELKRSYQQSSRGAISVDMDDHELQELVRRRWEKRARRSELVADICSEMDPVTVHTYNRLFGEDSFDQINNLHVKNLLLTMLLEPFDLPENVRYAARYVHNLRFADPNLERSIHVLNSIFSRSSDLSIVQDLQTLYRERHKTLHDRHRSALQALELPRMHVDLTGFIIGLDNPLRNVTNMIPYCMGAGNPQHHYFQTDDIGTLGEMRDFEFTAELDPAMVKIRISPLLFREHGIYPHVGGAIAYVAECEDEHALIVDGVIAPSIFDIDMPDWYEVMFEAVFEAARSYHGLYGGPSIDKVLINLDAGDAHESVREFNRVAIRRYLEDHPHHDAWFRLTASNVTYTPAFLENRPALEAKERFPYTHWVEKPEFPQTTLKHIQASAPYSGQQYLAAHKQGIEFIWEHIGTLKGQLRGRYEDFARLKEENAQYFHDDAEHAFINYGIGPIRALEFTL